MKFAGSDARPALSFAPRTHTLKTSGRIRDVFLCRHERVFNPSKGYIYVVKVQRDNEVTFVQRTFEEFQELHNKLRLLFPSSLLPSFPSRFVIGRSRGEAVAERRKEELNGYIWHLIHAAPEVAEVGTWTGGSGEVGTQIRAAGTGTQCQGHPRGGRVWDMGWELQGGGDTGWGAAGQGHSARATPEVGTWAGGSGDKDTVPGPSPG
ncbi:phosphatidylinositol 4-phosphate 3-kinase C2 domain-containing subunit beta-like [Malurus melanocephalus]|uniref:phosphatidylinositol 4-phosphate 3-kinase C2 domain-containing subunit beta-like n=1 Tax=Malurus melanocephalus TaxID=175006 RepID=UPI0025469E8E|nr:phosphatidylinositol 4-phosphate 3-kinase C2 domain-containing subunit beta-like [Malurus melanocephalus]